MNNHRRHHGGITGGMKGHFLDFSTTYNFYAPLEKVINAIACADITSYPDPDSYQAREALSRHTGYAISRIAVGHGATDLLWVLARTLIKRKSVTKDFSSVVLIDPCFSEFRAAVLSAGGKVYTHKVEKPNFKIVWEHLEEIIDKTKSTILAIETPHNPSGAYTPVESVVTWALKHPDVTVILDISFLALSHHHKDFPSSIPDNMVLICSLTKTFAVAGLRVGYMLARPSIIIDLEKHRPTWSISSLAQNAIIAMTESQQDILHHLTSLFLEMEEFVRHLRSMDIPVLPSCTLFVLMKHENALLLVKRLQEEYGILVRSCVSFGMHNYVRLSLRPRHMVSRLLAALREGYK